MCRARLGASCCLGFWSLSWTPLSANIRVSSPGIGGEGAMGARCEGRGRHRHCGQQLGEPPSSQQRLVLDLSFTCRRLILIIKEQAGPSQHEGGAHRVNKCATKGEAELEETPPNTSLAQSWHGCCHPRRTICSRRSPTPLPDALPDGSQTFCAVEHLLQTTAHPGQPLQESSGMER